MESEYDLVVIGSGTAAMGAAIRVRAAGWRAAVVDFRPYGGTCALRGCDPKKMLVGGAEAIDHARQMACKGGRMLCIETLLPGPPSQGPSDGCA